MTEAAVATPIDLGHALAMVLRGYLDGARAALDELPGGPRGFQVLTIAGAADCPNQAGMAKDLGLDRTVMTHLIDELEAAGLVERRPDPADRRARQVLLTPAGRTARGTAATAVKDVERSVLAALSDPEADQFRTLLHKLVGPARPAVGEPCTTGEPCAADDPCAVVEPCGG
jgi:DNA-binding MarR family transcriptional regulator